MQKVFAIFIMLLTLSGCNISHLRNKDALQATYKQNSILTLPGDFDGDNEIEHVYIVKDEAGDYNLVFMDGSNTKHTKKLSFNIVNSSAHVEDVNKDGREDLIIYTIDNSVEKIYAFSFMGSITELLTPELIESLVSFKSNGSQYSLRFGNLERKISSVEKLYLKFYYTDYDYEDNDFIFISEGAISDSHNNPVYIIQSIYEINKSGLVEIKDIKIEPYKLPKL